jgi:hypothetical protein
MGMTVGERQDRERTLQVQNRLARAAERIADALERPSPDRALDQVAYMLCDPQWGAGMLEDIADLVRATGRSVENIPDPDDPESEGISTWARH